MTKGRSTKPTQLDGRRCDLCKKVAKDFIDGKYLCRKHSPAREGFVERLEAVEKQNDDISLENRDLDKRLEKVEKNE